MPKLPLEGIRVIDMTVVWAGPFGGALLGDLGAEVIKIDSTQRLDMNSRGQNFTIEQLRENGGDPSPDAKPYNLSANFNSVGRNKLSVTMDLPAPRGYKRSSTASPRTPTSSSRTTRPTSCTVSASTTRH